MTVSAAFKTLKPPLVFGDDKQIAAAEFIATVEACVEATKRCDHQSFDCKECSGTGEVDCECDCGHEHSRNCGDCDGSGRLASACDKCLAGFAFEVMEEAKKVLRYGWPSGAKVA